jgi:hypothetical protein
MTAPASDAKAPWPALWVGLAIFIFPPFGLYVLWRHPVLCGNKKWWGGACAWTVWWFATLGGTPSPEGSGAGNSTEAVSQSAESNENEISAVDLLKLAGNASRVRKRFPGRFVVTGKVLKVEDHAGSWGRKTYSVDLIGTYNSKGLVDSWVTCEMSKDKGLEDISTGQYVQIEGEFDRASGRDFVWMKKCWLK